MKSTILRRSSAIAAIALTASIGLAGCSSDDNNATDNTATGGSSESSGGGATGEGEPFGDLCAKVPATGDGSFNGMAQDPVATAAGNNEALSTLVKAVGVAGLGDTLNSAPAITVFAPDNDAFAAIPADTLNSVLADKKLLTSILTLHVLPERLEPSEIAGDQATLLDGSDVTVTGDASGMTVAGAGNKTPANVVCGDIQTSNATVYIIDAVLMPAAS